MLLYYETCVTALTIRHPDFKELCSRTIIQGDSKFVFFDVHLGLGKYGVVEIVSTWANFIFPWYFHNCC